MREPVTIKSLQEHLCAERAEAVAIRYLITKEQDIPDLVSCYGWLEDDIPTMAVQKLGPFRDQLHDVWHRCYSIPKGTPYEVMKFADRLLNTHGIESIRAEGATTLMYCNAGDSYAATLCHLEAPGVDKYFISTWADFVEELERKGIRTKENWED